VDFSYAVIVSKRYFATFCLQERGFHRNLPALISALNFAE